MRILFRWASACGVNGRKPPFHTKRVFPRLC